MSVHDFWHGDIDLLRVYEKAYIRHISLMAWYQGYYNYIAYGVNMQNMWKKKGSKNAEFPKYADPMERYDKPIITTENLEEEFRKQQIAQQSWLFKK